jgi:hypothetical protein
MTAKMSTREGPLIGLKPAIFPTPDFVWRVYQVQGQAQR